MRRAAEPRASSNEELVVVYESSGPLAAEVAKSKLASEGIEAMLKSEAQSAFALMLSPTPKPKAFASNVSPEIRSFAS